MQSVSLNSKPYKVGFTASAFDLLHAGHIAMLQEAKSICEHLIVGLQVDPSIDRPMKNRPIQSLLERQLQLHAVRYVDQIIVYHGEDELLDILTSLPINVRIIGEEYRDKHFTGCKIAGIDIHYNRRRHGWSSSSLRWRAAKTEEGRSPPASVLPE